MNCVRRGTQYRTEIRVLASYLGLQQPNLRRVLVADLWRILVDLRGKVREKVAAEASPKKATPMRLTVTSNQGRPFGYATGALAKSLGKDLAEFTEFDTPAWKYKLDIGVQTDAAGKGAIEALVASLPAWVREKVRFRVE